MEVPVIFIDTSPGGRHGHPLQYSCLENPHGREPGGLQSMGLQSHRQDWATKHITASWRSWTPVPFSEKCAAHLVSKRTAWKGGKIVTLYKEAWQIQPQQIQRLTLLVMSHVKQQCDMGAKACIVRCVHAQSFSHVQFLATLWMAAHLAPLSMGFSSQEYWNGLPFPLPRNLPDPGIKPTSPTSAFVDRFFTTWHSVKRMAL